ncbi:GNAT family N-acetyltransferase [Streptomyces yangpuensis]
MTWTFTDDPAAYRAAAGAAVAARPAPNTLLLSIADALERRGLHAFGPEAPFFGWWTGPDGDVRGALVCTPPYPLQLGALPAEAVRALADELAAEPLLAGLRGINARRADADALATAWGRPTVVAEEHRLYRLAGLIAPHPAPTGRARVATADDLPLLAEWLEAFHTEVQIPAGPSEAQVRDRLSYGGFLLWEDGGAPVSLAAHSRPIGSTSRIGPVYTPPGLRGHGYAAGVTHAASEAAYAAGASEVVLFTDLANPTSNGVYLRLGYVPVEDRALIVPA